MKPQLPIPGRLILAALPMLLAHAHAGLLGPYTADANTVYLYHLDEAAGTSTAANAGSAASSALSVDGNPLATGVATTVTTVLGSTGFTGFGKCANLSANDLALGVNTNANTTFDASGATTPDSIAISSLLGSGNAFTMEALVNLPSLTSATNRHIWSTDSNNATRGFQFRITTAGAIEFNFIGTAPAGFTVAIPTTGAEAFVANQWFHVALVHDETGGVITNKVYWTKVDASRSQATLLTTNTVETVLGTVTGPLVLGNEGRNTGSGVNMTEGFLGLIDEARICNVAKTASQFIFFNDDTDSDGLSDAWEVANFGNITSQDGSGDADSDTFTNAQEYAAGTNPNNAAFTPNDTDGDGLQDAWEITNFGNITAQNGSGDPDSDYSTNLQEQAASTNPKNSTSFPDSDADSMADGWEAANGLSVGTDDSLSDLDGDGFDNLAEFIAKSNPNDAAWTPEKAKLAHRWSFNNSLSDSVGTSHATLIDPDANNAVGGTSTLSSTDILLGGGDRATSDYINLGSNLIGGGKAPITLEFWATRVAVQNWARVFDFGSGTTEYLMMAWNQGTNAATDRVEWVDAGTASTLDNKILFTTGTEYHVVVNLQPGAGASGGTLVTYYAAPSTTSLGAFKGSFSTANNLADLNDSLLWLGRSQYADATANARYNEFRIWNGTLTSTEREAYHTVGADVLNVSDTDSDGLTDAWEVLYFGNITAQDGSGDPDGDLYTNSDELLANTNPTVQVSSPDSDLDGLADGWEVQWFALSGEDLSTVINKYSGNDDPDADGFRNSAEYAANTSPTDAAFNPLDTDGDGLLDSFEQAYFSSLAQGGSSDTDSDGATNLQEQAAGSNPTLASSTPTDADGDGTVDSAETFQPYTVDSNTLHLWHLDEIKAPAGDAGSDALSLTSLANGALLWSPSLAGFKTGLDASAGRATTAGGLLSALPLAGDATDNTTMQYAGADGAFTFEAIVKVGFDPAATQPAGDASAPMQILSGEGDAGTNRVWQFRLTPIGTNNTGTAPTLEFINIHGEVGVQTLTATIPTGSDPNAIVQGGWYHVAVTYNGAEATADNLKLYWTKLDPTHTAANPILSTQMTSDLITESPDFVIGNEGRVNGGSNGNFVGVIDEVRISSVARSASQFLFTAPADSDADGMLDTWETTYFGGLGQPATGDFDNDGTDNLAEFRLGLIPNNGASRFAASITGATLQWPSNTGTSFTVQRSTDLANWTTVSTVTGTAGSASYTDPAPPAGKAFYKVILNP